MEVAVKQHSVMANVIRFCESKMAEQEFTGLTLVAEGKAVNKAISINEIIKRKHVGFTSEVALVPSQTNQDEPMLRISISRR